MMAATVNDGRTHLYTTAIRRTLVFVFAAGLTCGWSAINGFTSVISTVKVLRKAGQSVISATRQRGTHSASPIEVTDAIKVSSAIERERDNINPHFVLAHTSEGVESKERKDCSRKCGSTWRNDRDWIVSLLYRSSLAWEAISKVNLLRFWLWREYISGSFVSYTTRQVGVRDEQL